MTRCRWIRTGFLVFQSLLVFQSMYVVADEPPRVQREIPFAATPEQTLFLDLYRPHGGDGPFPLVVWVHGGAWRRGSRDNMPLQDLVETGIAVASVDYRLSPVAKFPAQPHDIKAAIRYLRANASSLGLDPDRFAIAGASAGGHLAALVGISDGVEALDGSIGDDFEASSRVSAIIDLYGPTNFETILQQSTPHGLSVRVPALKLLIGGTPSEQTAAARRASPVRHVGAGDPPLLLVHGDQDPQVPINQAHELHGAYKRSGLIVQFEVIHGAAHGGPEFYDQERTELYREFLTRSWSMAAKR